jgi:hypothetical protein
MAVPGDWAVIAKLQAVEHIYPRTKPLILAAGFCRQGKLCEHFLFGNPKTEHRRKRDVERCFVVLHITDSMAAGPSRRASPVLASPVSSRHLLSRSPFFKVPSLGNVVRLCGASGNTLYWVLLLGLCGASGDTLYWVLLFGLSSLGQHTLLGIVVGLCGASVNTLLGIVVDLRGALVNTLY